MKFKTMKLEKTEHRNMMILHMDNGDMALFSYLTEVARFDQRTRICTVSGRYSNTTDRHVRYFINRLHQGDPTIQINHSPVKQQ
jgi:predicted GNAT family acetyltransferase